MKNYAITVLFLLVLQILQAQPSIEIDLAKFEPGKKHTQHLNQGSYKEVILKNISIATGVTYEIDVALEYIETTPFDWDLYLGKAKAMEKAVDDSLKVNISETCQKLQVHIDSLFKEKDENDIPGIIIALEKQIRTIEKDKDSSCLSLLDAARLIIKQTTISKAFTQPIRLNSSVEIHLTVRSGEKNWEFVFRTTQGSNWKIFYGFTYVADWMNPTRQYFTEQADSSLYTIRREHNDRKDYLESITPTVMFTWMPWPNRQLKPGFTGGISLDLTDPTAMFSPSLVIGDNLSINLGVVITQKKVLKGQYREGQEMNAAIDFDGLHEDVYMADYFVSLAFRFSSNPFAPKEEDEETED